MKVKVGRVAKFVVAALAAGAVAASVALDDMVITAAEGVTIALAVLGALGVYRVPNGPQSKDPAAFKDSRP